MGAEWKPVNKSGSGAVLGAPTSFGSTATFMPANTGSWTPITATVSGTGPATAPQIAQPSWQQPSAAPRPVKVYVSNEEVRRIIANVLGAKLAEDFRLFLGDNSYFLQPLADAQQIITKSGLARAEYMPETFDCDDFAIVLKSHFCEAAYKDFERRPPHCIGLIWGELPHVHAINWMINDDYRLRLIEPQTGEVFDIKPEHRNVTFMMA
jgi:hypothetical protein